jgi:hypothetical protein
MRQLTCVSVTRTLTAGVTLTIMRTTDDDLAELRPPDANA